MDGAPSEAVIHKLRDRLAALFTEQQPLLPPALGVESTSALRPSSLPLVPFFEKFFRTSKKRRVQPGLRTFVMAFAALFFTVLALALLSAAIVGSAPALPIFLSAILLGAFMPALGAGLYHHLRMQHLFVKLRLPGRGNVYGTISQTIILVSRDRRVHYFYRDTRGDTIEPWEETKCVIGDASKKDE